MNFEFFVIDLNARKIRANSVELYSNLVFTYEIS